jgi:hypothetical protein
MATRWFRSGRGVETSPLRGFTPLRRHHRLESGSPFRVFPGLPHPAPSARELSQLLDGLRLRRLACLISCRRRPWGFENQTFTCPTGLASGDEEVWPFPSSMAVLPKLNCNARRSTLERGPKPHVRLEPVAKPRKRGTRTDRNVDSRPFDRLDPSRRKQPGEQRRRSVRPVRRSRLECSTEARFRFGSTCSASNRSRGVRKSTLTSRNESAMPDRSEATGPSQHSDFRRVARSGQPAWEAWG